MATRYKDYAGLFPNYQQLGQQLGAIKNQQWQGGGDVLSKIFQVLAQLQMQKQADEFYNPTVTSTTPQQTVSTDLLGKPIGRSTTGYGGRPMFIPEPVRGQTLTTTENVDQSFNPNTLLRGLMSSNPEIQRRAQTTFPVLQAMAPKTVQRNPFEDTYSQDPITGKETLIKPAVQKQQNFSTAFSDFLRSNIQKYGNDPNGLEAAYSDFKKQSLSEIESKEKIKAKNRAQRGGKVLTTFTSDDGYKTIIYENPDKTLRTIKSNDKVKETEGSTLKAKDSMVSSLVELASRVESSAKPEYLGGVVSGLAGQGAGGVTGAIREATGFIDDQEVIFRADVASIKDQLLRARSGAQINEAEYKRLVEELPEVTQPKNVFDARLKGFKQRLQDIINSRSKSSGGKKKKTMTINGATVEVEE